MSLLTHGARAFRDFVLNGNQGCPKMEISPAPTNHFETVIRDPVPYVHQPSSAFHQNEEVIMYCSKLSLQGEMTYCNSNILMALLLMIILISRPVGFLRSWITLFRLNTNGLDDSRADGGRLSYELLSDPGSSSPKSRPKCPFSDSRCFGFFGQKCPKRHRVSGLTAAILSLFDNGFYGRFQGSL